MLSDTCTVLRFMLLAVTCIASMEPVKRLSHSQQLVAVCVSVFFLLLSIFYDKIKGAVEIYTPIPWSVQMPSHWPSLEMPFLKVESVLL